MTATYRYTSTDGDMDETRPMPKRTREDFLTIQKLGAALDGLESEATLWQVATKCASAMAEALHAHAVLIHEHDGDRRELRSIGVHGPNAGDLLGTTTNVDDDYVATAVLTNRKALMLRLDGSLPRFVPERHRLVGTTRSLAAFPVMREGGCVAIIEIVGVGDERHQGVKDACELVAQRLSVAFAAPVAPSTPPPPTLRSTPSGQRPKVSPGSYAKHLSDEGSRFGIARKTPSMFPKRAPTLSCRERSSARVNE